MTRDGLGAAVIRKLLESLAGEIQRVLDAHERALVRDRRLDPLPTGVSEGNDVSCKIAAVDRRNISWIERTQIHRVIPIIEMAAKLENARHGLKGCFQPPDRLKRPRPPEVVRAHRG